MVRGDLDVEIVVNNPPHDGSPAYIEVPELWTLDMTCNVTNENQYPDGTLAYRWTREGDPEWEVFQRTLVMQVGCYDAYFVIVILTNLLDRIYV